MYILKAQIVPCCRESLKSKGSQCAEDVAEAPSEITTIQGSNALRVAAITLGNALSDESLPERKVILGDLNAYSAEDPVAVLTDYTLSLVDTLLRLRSTGMDEGSSWTHQLRLSQLAEEFDAEGFSYWFYGTEQVGSLDHVPASEAMLADAIDATGTSTLLKFTSCSTIKRFVITQMKTVTPLPMFPFRSSDHDPFIATFDLQADGEEEEETMRFR